MFLTVFKSETFKIKMLADYYLVRALLLVC